MILVNADCGCIGGTRREVPRLSRSRMGRSRLWRRPWCCSGPVALNEEEVAHKALYGRCAMRVAAVLVRQDCHWRSVWQSWGACPDNANGYKNHRGECDFSGGSFVLSEYCGGLAAEWWNVPGALPEGLWI